MKVLVWDTETTGIPDDALPFNHPRQPRICQLAWALLDLQTGKVIEAQNDLIKPDGWTIPAEVTEVHGITNEMAESLGIAIIKALRKFYAAHLLADIQSGHNLEFDRKMTAIEFAHMGKPDYFAATPFICTQAETADLCAIAPTVSMLRAGRHYSKSPKLQEAVHILLGDHEFKEHAHDACNDVMACVRLLIFLRDRGRLKQWMDSSETAGKRYEFIAKWGGNCAETGQAFDSGDSVLKDPAANKVYCQQSQAYKDWQESRKSIQNRSVANDN